MNTQEFYTPVGILKSRRAKGHLSESEIRRVIHEYQTCNDAHRQRDLEEQVVSTHVLGVLKTLSKFTKSRHEETLSLAYIAIKKAMSKYHPSHRANFLTYANLWARHEIQRQATDEDFELYRRPFDHHQRRRAYRKIEVSLEQKTGRVPSVDEVLSEAINQRNALFFKGRKPMTTHGLELFLSKFDDRVIRIDDDQKHLAIRIDARGVNSLNALLLAELRNKIDGLFEGFYEHILSCYGFVEVELILEHELRDATFTTIGPSIDLSRQQTEKLWKTAIPAAAEGQGYPSPQFLGPIAAITALACESLNEALPDHLQRFAELNPKLCDKSLDGLHFGEDYINPFMSSEQKLSKQTKKQPIIVTRRECYASCNEASLRRQSASLLTIGERIAIGNKAKPSLQQPLQAKDLLAALRATLMSDEYQDRTFFPHGRSVLHAMYQDTQEIDRIIASSLKSNDLILIQNDAQGEAIKFWLHDRHIH